MHFEFTTPNRILFGPGTAKEIPDIARTLGQRAFVICDLPALANPFINQLADKGIIPLPHIISGEPTLVSVLEATRAARADFPDLIIGIGGGSVIDTGKAVAALLANEGDLLDYLEVIGAGRPLEKPSMPYIAVPTTAGTGSEATRNAVIGVPAKKVKVSLRSPFMLPHVAIVDPELTHSLPPETTASTGMDALTQCIEPFVCNAPNPIVDVLCRDGINRAVRSLRKACENGNNVEAREDMSLASLYGGMALTNAKLGAVHGFAGVLGGMYPAPHGAVCARLLPFVMDANIHALRNRDRTSPAIERFAEVARLLTGNAFAKVEDGIRWVQALARTIKIPPLTTYGVSEADFPEIVAQAKKASSMKGNPIKLTDNELTAILQNAL